MCVSEFLTQTCVEGNQWAPFHDAAANELLIAGMAMSVENYRSHMETTLMQKIVVEKLQA